MALQDYNSLLVEHLGELVAAADLADSESAAEYIERLRVEGFDPEHLAEASELLESGDFNKLQEWAGEHAARLSPDVDPFEEGAFDDFDIDDAFLDLEDTGFREPSQEVDPSELLGELEEDSPVMVLDEVSLTESVSDSDAGEGRGVPSRPHVLSGKFNLVDMSKVNRGSSLSDALDAAAASADEEVDQDRQTRPNVAPDLSDLDSVDEPAPPAHRLPATSDISDEIATTPPELADDDSPHGDAFRSTSEASEPELRQDSSDAESVSSVTSDAEEPISDEFSIEILDEPSADEQPVALRGGGGFDFGFEDLDGPEPPADDEDDFDLGLSTPRDLAETRPGSNAATTRPGPNEDIAERNRELTPLRTLPAQDPEDMFFELAEALAAESSAVEQYRGEPLLRAHAAETNPFGSDAPTGTQHPPIPAAVNPAAQSHVQTNMNAILLEAHRLRSAGELEAALDITKKVLSRGPNRDAENLRNEIETQLERASLEKLGELDQTPRLAVKLSKMAELDLDHRAGYIISQVDGMMTLEDLIELSGMSRLETLDVFCDLLEQGVIELS